MPELVLIRHGQTDVSRTGAYSGSLDVPLNQEGLHQSSKWSWLRDIQVDVDFACSPLSRAVESAKAAGIGTVALREELVEWDLGPLEGEVANDFRERHPGWNLFCDGPPSPGEQPRTVISRARKFVDDFVLTSKSQVIVAFSHGQLIKAMTSLLLTESLYLASRLQVGEARAAWLEIRDASTVTMKSWNASSAELKAANHARLRH